MADRPGTWAALAAGMDDYHAANLLEALRLVPDTGDWHGSLRQSCEIALQRYEIPVRPNQKAEDMAARAIELASALDETRSGQNQGGV